MTKNARISEINCELNHMDDTLQGCDWCEGCGGEIIVYNKLLKELKDLEGGYLRLIDGQPAGFMYDYRVK